MKEVERLREDIQAGEELCLWQQGSIKELKRDVDGQRGRRQWEGKKRVKERNRLI